MYKLNSLKNKLTGLGYQVYIKNEDGKEYLKGGYSGDDIEKNLSIQIEVLIEENQYVFIDWNKQIATKKIFTTIQETVDYIKMKYPL